MTNGTIHYMIVKEFCFRNHEFEAWNTIYHCAEFENSDYITIHSIYDIINSVDSNYDDFLKDLILYILFECTEYINF